MNNRPAGGHFRDAVSPHRHDYLHNRSQHKFHRHEKPQIFHALVQPQVQKQECFTIYDIRFLCPFICIFNDAFVCLRLYSVG
jgi:hypothetical protein